MGHNVLQWNTVVIGSGGTGSPESVEAMAHVIDGPICKDCFQGLSDLGINDLVEWGVLVANSWWWV